MRRALTFYIGFILYVTIFALAVRADTVGNQPTPGGNFATIDQTWLNGLAGGQNQLRQYGITAHAGGGQANAFRLNPGIALFQIDTVATTGDSVSLPPCKPPFQFLVRNNGANAANVFSANNSTDTINGTIGSTALAIAANSVTLFACIEAGQWSTVTGSGGGGGGSPTGPAGGDLLGTYPNPSVGTHNGGQPFTNGTVTSVAPGPCGIATTPNPIVATGTVNSPINLNNTVTSTPYTIQPTDACGLLLLSSGAFALTLPAATTIGFGSGVYFNVNNQSGISTSLTITGPSTLDGTSVVVIPAASTVGFQSDGTNYHYTAIPGTGGGSSTIPGGLNTQIQYNNSGAFGGLTASMSGGCGVSAGGSSVGNTLVGTFVTQVVISTLTGATPTIPNNGCGQVFYLSNGSLATPTIAEAGTNGWVTSSFLKLCNVGAGTQVITPSGGTIYGQSNLSIASGSQTAPNCFNLRSDGVSNYQRF